MGLPYFPEHGSTTEELISNADLAMYEAKNHGKNQYRFFDNSMNDTAKYRANIENALQILLREETNNELSFNYQPKFDIVSGKMIGAEAFDQVDPSRNGIYFT